MEGRRTQDEENQADDDSGLDLDLDLGLDLGSSKLVTPTLQEVKADIRRLVEDRENILTYASFMKCLGLLP